MFVITYVNAIGQLYYMISGDHWTTNRDQARRYASADMAQTAKDKAREQRIMLRHMWEKSTVTELTERD